jgi:hypothetical protein
VLEAGHEVRATRQNSFAMPESTVAAGDGW